MSEASVVLDFTVKDMLDHQLTTTPACAQQVVFGEGFQQRLGLIEPRGIDGCEQDMDTRRQVANL